MQACRPDATRLIAAETLVVKMRRSAAQPRKDGGALAGLPEKRRSLAEEEVGRARGEAEAEFGGTVEYRSRKGTERAGIEHRHGRIEDHPGPGGGPETGIFASHILVAVPHSALRIPQFIEGG